MSGAGGGEGGRGRGVSGGCEWGGGWVEQTRGGACSRGRGWGLACPWRALPQCRLPSARRDARNMARDVQNTFYDIVAEQGAMEHAQAVDYVKKLMTKGRYSLDVWS